MKEEPLNKVMTAKASIMQRLNQAVQEVAEKCFRRACKLFCCPLRILSCEELTFCSAQNHQQTEDKTTQVALHSPPSTILIVNISNSTLINCVIGYDNYPSAVTESQPLMHEPDHLVPNEMQCSDSCGHQRAPEPPPPLPPAETPSISIVGSSLSGVIIGDSNYMNVEYTSEALTTTQS
ncbi:hypothetical protein JOB18_008752 [Solea senegalensis]|uniref:Uncharacterized protein n=1 Tax=Solea senegalensis TaxID=28829 RepID=A0AAV6PRF5_SOLSE|nr:uncharacterized protein si:dkey-29h14.10 [Solea senegalensis]KAG7474438.1 hypothetical protein JOB18_008752 [Solea senegalensis]